MVHDRQLSPWARRAWILAAALGLFLAIWLVAALISHDQVLSVTIATGVDAVVALVLAPLVPGLHQRAPSSTRAQIAEGLGQLRNRVCSQAADQFQALTDRGVLAVPWSAHSFDADSEPINGDSIEELATVLAAGGQLAIIGGSQSGKTTLATRIVEYLSTTSQKQPVLFALASWNPNKVRLKPWMLDILRNQYNMSTPDQNDSLEAALDERLIIPIFDGLDEIDVSYVDTAARSIHNFVRKGPAAVTCLQSPLALQIAAAALPDAVLVSLSAVGPDEVSRYLLNSVLADREQWLLLADRIVTERDSALAKALSSPLMSWLVKSVYATHPGLAEARQVPDPTELLNTQRFPTAEAIDRHLLRSLPSAVFARREAIPNANEAPSHSFRPKDAERWLSFLAAMARNRVIAFWELRYYTPLYRIALPAALAIGVGISLIGRVIQDFCGPAYLLLAAGCIFGFGFSRGYADARSAGPNDPTRIGYRFPGQKDGDLSFRFRRLARWLSLIVLAYGAGLATDGALTGSVMWKFGMSVHQALITAGFALVLSGIVANVGGRLAGVVLTQRPEWDAGTGARAGDPLLAISGDRRSGMYFLPLSLIMLALGYYICFLICLPGDTIWVLTLAPLSAVIATLYWNEWPCYKIAHLWLAWRNRLPWSLSEFLHQCHNGGILRKNGNYFEFRHRRLQASLGEQRPWN